MTKHLKVKRLRVLLSFYPRHTSVPWLLKSIGFNPLRLFSGSTDSYPERNNKEITSLEEGSRVIRNMELENSYPPWVC